MHLGVARVRRGTPLVRDSEITIGKGFCVRRERLRTLLYAILLISLWDYCIGPVEFPQVPLVLPPCQSATPPADDTPVK